MLGFLSGLFGKHREPITIRARKVVISGNVLNDGSRPIDVEAEEVLLLGNRMRVGNQKPTPPWYQRPVGYIAVTVVAGLIVLAIWSLWGT